jgi:putative two-component system response regulator
MDRPCQILVVDDEQLNREMLSELLDAFGYHAILADNGPAALAILSPGIDLVLLDVVMPGMDGFEVARRIRATPAFADLPIIMVTGLISPEDRLQAVEAGANDFVAKPLDSTELRVRMASLLKMKAAQDALKQHDALYSPSAARRL